MAVVEYVHIYLPFSFELLIVKLFYFMMTRRVFLKIGLEVEAAMLN